MLAMRPRWRRGRRVLAGPGAAHLPRARQALVGVRPWSPLGECLTRRWPTSPAAPPGEAGARRGQSVGRRLAPASPLRPTSHPATLVTPHLAGAVDARCGDRYAHGWYLARGARTAGAAEARGAAEGSVVGGGSSASSALPTIVAAFAPIWRPNGIHRLRPATMAFRSTLIRRGDPTDRPHDTGSMKRTWSTWWPTPSRCWMRTTTKA